MSLGFARRRIAIPVKHGCAFEERKMLNCIGIFREKQQTWLDSLIILLSWDMIRINLVSDTSDRATTGYKLCLTAVAYPGRQCVSVDDR